MKCIEKQQANRAANPSKGPSVCEKQGASRSKGTRLFVEKRGANRSNQTARQGLRCLRHRDPTARKALEYMRARNREKAVERDQSI